MNATALRASGYLFTNRLHVFLMPVFPTLFWNMWLKLPLPFSYYVMIVLTAAAGYMYNIWTDHEEDAINYDTRYLVIGRGHRGTLAAMIACYVGSNLCALAAGWGFLFFNLLQHVLGCLYSTRVPIGARTVRIKEVPFLKNVYAALFWSFALMLTPFVYAGVPVTASGWVIVFICFGMSFFVELSWDLRDVAGDRAAGVRTVPIVLGIRFAVGLLSAVHVLTCLLAFWAVREGLLGWPYAVVYAVHLGSGLAWLAWYVRQPDKTPGSHLYVVWLGVLFIAGIGLVALGG